MSIPFRDASFKTATGTVARSNDQRYSDEVNVMEFNGIDPNGTSNSSGAIQAALDAAFGSAGAPHGAAGKYQNVPGEIPAGDYRVDSGLLLSKIVGGHIFGAGKGCTRIRYGGTIAGGRRRRRRSEPTARSIFVLSGSQWIE